MAERPSTATELEKLLNKTILVYVKDGRRLRGVLKQYDEYMNLVLEDVEEYSRDESATKHKLIVLKGGNLQSISL